ncbi:superoxide dismutase [Bacillaceae bacterium W0354]
MSKKETLLKFVNELERWAIDLKSKWSNAIATNSISEEKITQFELGLNEMITQINNLKKGTNQLDSKIADDLRKQAIKLSDLWNDMFNRKKETKVPIGKHVLPPLPYPYDALEPTISEEIMRLHHDKHHKSYVEGLNKAEKEMQKARQEGNYDLIKHWEREAAFNGAGHYLHTIFWNVMCPKGGGKPTGSLMREIESTFGSFNQFKKHFSEAAKKVEGVGWTLLVWSPRSHRLEILQAEKHQNLTQWDVIPLLVLDIWEHAYYLQYKNNRGKYVDNWWNVVNWNEVEKRFQAASKLKWKPY